MSITADDTKAFPKLDDEDLRQLMPLASCETYDAGAVILELGQSDIDLFVVERGGVDIQNPTDADHVIATHTAGSFIGDIDLLTRRPVIIRAVANGDGEGGPTRVLRVPGHKLRQVLNAVPSLGEKLMNAFTMRRDALAAAGVAGLRVVGHGGCGATNRIREFLHKNFVPFTWDDPETPGGRALVERFGPGELPAVDCGGDNVLRNPTLQKLADCAGVWRGCPDGDFDLAIVGAGPAGIAAAVYAASEGLRTVVLDRLGPGGQAGGSSKIENFIGFPAGLSGTELATRGVLQMLKFGATMIAPVEVLKIEPAGEGRPMHKLTLDCGAKIQARVVLGSTGVAWKRLPADGAERFERAGVYYTCTAVEAQLYDASDVAVVGAGNSAGQAAMFMADQCRTRKVHLLVRSTLGPSMSEYLVGRLRQKENVVIHEGVETTKLTGTRELETIELVCRHSGDHKTLDCAAMFVFIGAEPHADWMPDAVLRDAKGFVLTGNDVTRKNGWPLKDRDPCPLETSVPGILAAGDVRAGSTKRVGFAVGDGSLAVTCVHTLCALPA